MYCPCAAGVVSFKKKGIFLTLLRESTYQCQTHTQFTCWKGKRKQSYSSLEIYKV